MNRYAGMVVCAAGGLMIAALGARGVGVAGARTQPAGASEPIVVIAVAPERPELDARPQPEPAPEVDLDVVPDPTLEPATKPAKKLMALRDEIANSVTDTAYQHRTQVERDEGVYRWDCSGMVAWMLRRAAPKARKALDKGRPVARDFYRTIARASTQRARSGWRRLEHIEDVRPGDVFAWPRPPQMQSRNTGHVGFAVEPARPVPDFPGVYTLRILDATSLRHEDDTRPAGGKGGFGEGTILLVTDEDGRGTAYGWFGRRSRGVIATDIVFGRVTG